MPMAFLALASILVLMFPSGHIPSKNVASEHYVKEKVPNEQVLLPAIHALTSHIEGSIIISGTEISQHKSTIAANLNRLNESVEIISALFELIKSYDEVHGGIFLEDSTISGFDRTNVSDEDIHWVVFSIMQYVFDQVYTLETLNDENKRALLDGFKFESSASFPGAVMAPSNPQESHTAKISASFPDSFGRDTQHWDRPAIKPTGTYLAPGSIVRVRVPEALVDANFSIRIGAHSWDHEAKNRRPVKRLSRASILYPIVSGETFVASPYGGGIYIEVPPGAGAGVVDVSIYGAVRSPYFSMKSFHTTTNTEWITTERNFTAPWADFQTEKFMMQVPTSWIYALDDPTKLMKEWDAAMDAINDLMGFPRIRGKETMYVQPDVILRSSVHAPGYPAVNVIYNPRAQENGYKNNYLVRGPENGSETEFHEQGHAYFFPRFANTNEAEVNLHYVAMANQVYDMDLGKAMLRSYGPGDRISENQLPLTAVFWMTSFSYSFRETPMQNWEAAYQVPGYARYVDLAHLFGWEGLGKYFLSFNQDYEDGIITGPVNNNRDIDGKLIRLSEAVSVDIRPLWHFWGIHPENAEYVQSQIEALNIEPSRKIYDRLEEYKTFVPQNNQEYQDFCLLWYNREPSIGGFGAERERTRQFDNTSYWQENNWDYSGTDPNQADGEIYTESSAERILIRTQKIIDLYFPDGAPEYDNEEENNNDEGEGEGEDSTDEDTTDEEGSSDSNLEEDIPFFIYIDPVSNKMHVGGLPSENYNIVLYNIMGQRVFRQNELTANELLDNGIELATYGSGFYFVFLEDLDELDTIIKKIIIK